MRLRNFLLPQPGDVGTTEDYAPGAVCAARLEAYGRQGLQVFDCLHATVRTSRGLVAGLHAKHETGPIYSESDRAITATLAELASLALT
jgi:hypothetical protein